MIEDITANWQAIMAISSLPAWFIVLYCRDVVKMKLKILSGKNRGAKFVVDIGIDKSIRIGTEIPKDGKKFMRENIEVTVNPGSLMFAPQFGIQAAIVPQGSKSILDPFADKKIDPIDGELFDLAIKKAKQLGYMNQGWMDTKEQKIMVLTLVAVAITGVLVFASMSQIGELSEYLKSALPAISTAVTTLTGGV